MKWKEKLKLWRQVAGKANTKLEDHG